LTKDELTDDEEEEPVATTNPRFALDKFYTFLKEKQQAKKELPPIPVGHTVAPLSFPAFCKAFRHRRPTIIYDLLQFLLGAQRDEFVDWA
jgi:hypothetical protein